MRYEKYSDFLEFIIVECYEYAAGLEGNKVYLCNIIDNLPPAVREANKDHETKLRKSIRRKLDYAHGVTTLTFVLPPANSGLEQRVNWLNSLRKYHIARGN